MLEQERQAIIAFSGDKIYGMNGGVPTTVVYNANGWPQHQVDDRNTIMMPVPAGGFVPATDILQFPNDTFVHAGDNNLTAYLNEQKILTVRYSSQIPFNYMNILNAGSVNLLGDNQYFNS